MAVPLFLTEQHQFALETEQLGNKQLCGCMVYGSGLSNCANN
jgi:hypothetical protein